MQQTGKNYFCRCQRLLTSLRNEKKALFAAIRAQLRPRRTAAVYMIARVFLPPGRTAPPYSPPDEWLQRDETRRENAVTRPIPHGLPLDARAPLPVCVPRHASLPDDNYFICRGWHGGGNEEIEVWEDA